MQAHLRRVKALQKTYPLGKAKSLSLRCLNNPGERDIGNDMVVGIAAADIAVHARKDHLLDPLPRGTCGNRRRRRAERNEVEEPALFITGNGMAGRANVWRTRLGNVQPGNGVDRIPETEEGDWDTELVEPGGEMARKCCATRKAK